MSDETPPPAVVDHPELRDIALDPEEVARYTGEYAIETPGGSIDVRIGGEGGGLVARVAGGPPNRLRHQGGHVFVPADDPRSRVMFTVRDDRAVSFTLDLRGERITARRAGADEPEVLDLPLTAEEMAVYEGTYLLGARDLPLRIWAGDGRLLSRAGGQRVTPLRYQGDHVFVPDFDDTVRLIFVVEDGRATRLTLYQGGRAVPAERQR